MLKMRVSGWSFDRLNSFVVLFCSRVGAMFRQQRLTIKEGTSEAGAHLQ